ncbi:MULTISPECIES: enoyl-CoA hydratase/isomerase family protein [unclassified Pigmentiphaga]|uniref:enoyl-CoA hydratase/isomerase family protein n=1 Tax=unclassified Pigmentiphaga TaxID=2626614 RepID=UPI000B40EECD|nr:MULTISPECIES: enoyl-CoA hydratase/isomerase family protein [unclassified Pigmentiphaga]OVZ65613.1 enoyl-CoA hydratase [Pigmentiphaga sp. NML030171]
MDGTLSFQAIRFQVDEDGIAVMTLNRPQARNALDMTMRGEIAEVAEQLRRSEDIRALIIIGEGGNFCAGGDLQSMGDQRPPASSRRRVAELNTWCSKLAALEMPVIAAVDGVAFGGGFNLCLAADFIMATPAARFCQVFARVGLIPDLSGLYLLPRMIGLQRAKELIYSARTIDAEEARSLGIVYGIVESDVLLARAVDMARRLSRGSRTAFGLTKSILNRSFETDPKTLADMETLSQAVAMSTEEHQNAVARFQAKEPLVFEPIGRPV